MGSKNRQFSQKLKPLAQCDEVVISGISGKYPECNTIDEFARRLYNKDDMVTADESRWRKDLFANPMGMGKLNELEKFDAEFFGCDKTKSDFMDAQLRMLLEISYECIWDAGIEPTSLSGSNTGVFIGNCFDEMLNAHSNVGEIPLCKQYLASQLADSYNFKGPSMAVDTACASSFSALTEALSYMRHKIIDQAIVAGVNLGLNPMMQYQFFKLNMLSPDGKCKCLDESANGYAKGEAVVAILLQRRSNAKRIYATVIHSKTNNDGYEEMGITFPTWESQRDLMKATYEEAGVNPHDVKYIEAHCTGTQAGDPEEMRAICESMCIDGRKDPIMVGAHKSNIGHTEASSGLCAVSKAIISLENELIPSNIHMKSPNPKVEGIAAGLIKPINENTPFQGDYVALNNFGFGGSNIHVLIKGPKIKAKPNNNQIVDKIPRLVNMCGRNEEAVQYFFSTLFEQHSEKVTRDLLALINDISKTAPYKKNNGCEGMTTRGFALIESADTIKDIKNYNIREVKDGGKKQVWYVMSGMGVQWTGMAKDLVKIEVIEKSILNLCQIMKKYSIDLWDLLMNEKKNISDSVLNSFLTIAAIQIALIDFLEYLDIKPDGIIGHSIGELTCAYADKCLTAEETIVMAYWRAKCIEEDSATRGSMAAVGLGVNEAKPLCPPNVNIACDNADDSVTVAGGAKAVADFGESLKAKNIFAVNVDSCGIAFHSPQLYSTRDKMTQKLKTVLPGTRQMTSRWISSNQSNTTKSVTAEYFVDNLLFPIRFNESLKQIPKNAVVIEVSPHCLLQSIIKRGLGPNISYVPLMRKNDDNANVLVSAVGLLYTSGLNPSVEKLYPKVEYPVSRGTKFIAPLVKWIHKSNYVVTKYPEFFSGDQSSKTRVVKVNMMDNDDMYVAGHVIDGRNLYPGTGYLLNIWKHLAAFHNIEYYELAVEFTDVVFQRATMVQQNKEITFNTHIDPKNGNFYLTENEAVVVTGNIKALPKNGLQYQYYFDDNSFRISKSENLVLHKEDIYTSLRLRGYDYKTSFQCVSEAYVEEKCVKARVEWTKNWVVFADNMIQISIVGVDTKGLFIPVRLDMIRFDPKVLLAEVAEMGDNPKLEAIFDYNTNIGVTKGLEFRGLKANLISRNINYNEPVVGDYDFVSYEGLVTETKADEDELVEYQTLCDKLAVHLSEKLELGTGAGKLANILAIFHNNEDKHVFKEKDRHLYSLLKDLRNRGELSVDALNDSESYQELNEDFLWKAIYDKWLIDTQIIAIYDNKKTLEIKALELNDSTDSVQELVLQSLDAHEFNAKLVYSIVKRSDLRTFPADDKTTEWDMRDSSIPTELKELDLIIYKNDSNGAIDVKELFEAVWDKLKDNAFFQIIFRDSFTKSEKLIRDLKKQKSHTMDRNTIRREAEKLGFTYIGCKGNRFGANAMLFRKITINLDVDKQVFFEINHNVGNWLDQLKEEISQIHNKPEGENIWVVGQNSAKNGILGMVYSLRKEINGMRVRSIFNFNGNKDILLENREELKQIIKKDLVFNVYKDNAWGFYKHNVRNSMNKVVLSEHCYLNNSNKGDLSSLKWFECQHKLWPIGKKDNQQLCHIYYSALNFRDIMLASGRLPADALPGDMALQDCILGLEFSGRDENCNRVMGMIPSKALATTCIVEDPEFLWPIPANWTMEEASTVPCVYSTAYYSLIIRGNLKRGEKVLIHSGTGGVGQAAINICMDMGCEVFITVGSHEKRNYLKKLFPKLTERNFSSSRDVNFKTHIMNATNGAGVDLVLNSLSDDKLKASLECLANNGRFLEIGKYDMSVNTKLDLSELIKNKTFHGILLDALFTTDETTPKGLLNDRKRIWDLISDGIKRGVVKPLNRSVFNYDECEEAFRFMASGKHMGKVVIKIKNEERGGEKVSLRGFQIPAFARTVFNQNKVYIISGGLGGFGLELIDWMIERGAQKFFITSRGGPKNNYQKSKLNRFRRVGGADIHIVTDLDVSQPKQATTLLTNASKFGEIGGIFHLALVLADAILENQTEETFKVVCNSKSDPFITLDIITRKYCPDLEYFVGFSSGVASRGNIGQVNYGYSNAILDKVCELRRADGYNGMALQWGVIADVGVVNSSSGEEQKIIIGTQGQRIPSCLYTLDLLLQSDKPVTFSFVKCESSTGDSGGGKDNFTKKLAHILGMDDLKKVDPNTKFLKLGMDSLMAVEIQLTIEREFGVVMTAQEIRELNISKVMEIAEGK